MATFVESELHYYDTWRNCSLDTSHSESMVEDDRVVVNFDKVKTAYLNDLGKSEESASSVDALGKDEDGNIYMVEFKNGDFTETDIRRKAVDSFLIFCDIRHSTIKKAREKLHFILVYNPNRVKLNHAQQRAIGMARLGRQPCSLYGLDKLEGFMFAKAYMMSADDFNSKLDHRITL